MPVLRVLVVDDDPLVLRSMRRGLAPIALVVTSSSVAETRTLLSTSATWTACIVEGELGDGTALDVLTMLGARRPPVIVVTGTYDVKLLECFGSRSKWSTCWRRSRLSRAADRSRCVAAALATSNYV